MEMVQTGSRRLPLEWLFDESTVRSMTQHFFHRGTPCVGSAQMVPEDGAYRLLELTSDREILLRDGEDHRLLSNVCRHEGGLIIDPTRSPPRSGDEKKLEDRRENREGNWGTVRRCPLHAWTYGKKGAVVHHPYYKDEKFFNTADGVPEKPCLPKKELMQWNGLLFPRDDAFLADLSGVGESGMFDAALLDTRNYSLVRTAIETVDYDFSWLMFMYVYQELTHVLPFHPDTFASIVDCRKPIRWEFGNRWSVQVADWNKMPPRSIEPSYQRYRELVRHCYKDALPPHGALWAAFYPNVMVEWYPLMTVVSTLWPLQGGRCRNVVEYYGPDFVPVSERGEVFTASRAAYNVTADEDGDICTSFTKGRRAVWESGDHTYVDHPHPQVDAGIDHLCSWVADEFDDTPFLRT